MKRILACTTRRLLYFFLGAMVLLCLLVFQKYATPCNDDSLPERLTSRLPYIYVITPTATKLEQKADLTRLSNTLRLVPHLHWILIEDSDKKTASVENILANCKLPYTHLFSKTVLKENEKLVSKGVPQRNAGLRWLRENFKRDGVVYFADDDNTYDIRLFEEMRYTRKVSIWPVGLVAGLRYEAPVVTDGKVTGWSTYFRRDRTFCTDMAGFAINLKIILDKPDVWFVAKLEVLETEFVTGLGIEIDDLEPRAENCTKVLVWHTRTQKTSLENEPKMLEKYGYQSDPTIEV